MSASLNAVSNFASVRDTPDVTSGSVQNVRSGGNRDSFSQVLRRTTDEGRSSGANSSRESDKSDKSDKKDKKGTTKKDSDTNTATAAPTDSNVVSEKSSLPITFLFGLPTEPLKSFDAQQGNNSSSSAIGAKDASVNQLRQLGIFRQIASDNGDPSLVMMPPSDIASADNAQSVKTGATDAKDSDLLAIGESGNSVKGAAGMLTSNTLAFAMRLGSGQTVTSPKVASSTEAVSSAVSDKMQPNFTAVTANAIQAASGSTLEENTHEHGGSEQAQNVVDLSAARTSEPFDVTKIAEEHTSTSAAQAPPDPSASTTSEPVRNVHMQLVSDDNSRVDVRLIDRGGELHVSVKSADPALTQNLQDHLPDLTARLDKEHMQTEVWVPKAAEPTKAESGNTNGSLSQSNSGSYSSNSDGKKDGRQQRKPDWVDALENYS